MKANIHSLHCTYNSVATPTEIYWCWAVTFMLPKKQTYLTNLYRPRQYYPAHQMMWCVVVVVQHELESCWHCSHHSSQPDYLASLPLLYGNRGQQVRERIWEPVSPSRQDGRSFFFSSRSFSFSFSFPFASGSPVVFEHIWKQPHNKQHFI